MLNTVVDLAGQDFVEVAAWLDNCGHPVETLGVVIDRLASGAMVTLHASGERSLLRFGCARFLLKGFCAPASGRAPANPASWQPALPNSASPTFAGRLEQFLAVRSGSMPNPCPPEVGLRMACLYDAIQASAASHGAITRISAA